MSAKVTTKKKHWPHIQYYFGDKDDERRNGHGENHWSGAESLETYNGQFMQNTMHGVGEYKWQHLGPNYIFISFEGYFYANNMHGYGTMSYADGRVYSGLYHNNIRWGPGVLSHVSLQEDVGLWREDKLIRLAWRPPAQSVTLDLTLANNGRDFVEPYRIMLLAKLNTIDDSNSAIDLLKDRGCDPLIASEIWQKLYPKNCTDIKSSACEVKLFERNYYGEYCSNTLEEFNGYNETIQDPETNLEIHYAWNNNKTILHMMKHCYRHENQRCNNVNITGLLSGQRFIFKPPGVHELNCRTLLMASYLGYISKVVQLIMENDVHPDVADCQGNSAIKYATAGEKVEVIKFLVEAGADVNCYNDSCCTPLGLALMKLLCVEKDIPLVTAVQSLLPPTLLQSSTDKIENVTEWNIKRDAPLLSPGGTFGKSPSKIKTTNNKKPKSTISLKDSSKKKPESFIEKEMSSETSSFDSFSEGERLYYIISSEYTMKITDLFQQTTTNNTVPYLFEIQDMIKEMIENDEDHKKVTEKNPKKAVSKENKMKTKLMSKEFLSQTVDDTASISSAEKLKMETLERIKQTTLHLLNLGANPCLVISPQPALVMASLSGCPELIIELVNKGANINETYTKHKNYTPLDLAIALPFTSVNLDLIRNILNCGGNANHLLQSPEYPEFDINGPSLLHYVLSKTTENETEEEIRSHVIELLLEHGCDPTTQFRGRSPLDIAMSKSLDLFDIFIRSRKTNLNAIINQSNQSALVKLFSVSFCSTIPLADRLQTLTNLILHGANPLLECYNGTETYQNLFDFANKTMENFDSLPKHADAKVKKTEKPKKEDKLASKSLGRLTSDAADDYKQALNLVKEYTRYLHIRWIQTKLVKDLIHIIQRFKHRHWSMIVKEHEDWKQTKLWVTTNRCLEIWNNLNRTNKRKSDNKVLEHLMCIIEFYNITPSKKSLIKITGDLNDGIQKEVTQILHEEKLNNMTSSWLPYVTPELNNEADRFFNICFECAMVLHAEKIECARCKLVSFCCEDCAKLNKETGSSHPCAADL